MFTNSPHISPQKQIPEISVKAIILGIILSIVLAAANAYIGLLVGLTISASIPAAVLSMGILRLFRKSNILESNMVQTAASAGEALAAGIIFTVPAFVMLNIWQHYQYWPTVALALVGGILGVTFSIPLRRILIVESKLAFPEGVATAEVLKLAEIGKTKTDALESNVASAKYLIYAAGIGALIKFLQSFVGLIPEQIKLAKSWFSGKLLIFANINFSSALLGIGYIIGLNISILVFLGGLIGTIIAVPLYWYFDQASILNAMHIPITIHLSQLPMDTLYRIADFAWQTCRQIGVGAMLVGGLWSFIILLKPLYRGFAFSLRLFKQSYTSSLLRTERDLPIFGIISILMLAIIALFFVYNTLLKIPSGDQLLILLMVMLTIFFGFIFSAIAGYMAGLVGSSNNPISGITLVTVIVSAFILLHFFDLQTHSVELLSYSIIFLSGMICSAAAISGDNLQDLKCGNLLGATPWKQQVFQYVGVITAAFIIPMILQLLHSAYGIGIASPINPQAVPLAAPQASLIKTLVAGIIFKKINWIFIFMGCVLAILLIIIDTILKTLKMNFRIPILAVAVGIYLPFGLTIPILLGGISAYLLQKKGYNRMKGIVIAAGLITGEALMGVIVAFMSVIAR